MSGIMIKTGIYGIIRMLSFLGAPPLWWGWLLLAIGIVSGVLGVLYALAQHDLKGLLAYHSVENIGIIMMGLGVGMIGWSAGMPSVAILGMAGGLLHVLNHALFKGLLFLGAGSVYQASPYPRDRPARRAYQKNALYRLLLFDRRSRHFRPAAPERICKRIFDLSRLASRRNRHGR